MYKLDLNKAIPLLPWNYVFRTLSLESFDLLYQFLRFPMYPTMQLQEIARDFVIAFSKGRGITCSFVPSNNFLEGMQATFDSQVLFNNVFNTLETQQLAKVVYVWASQTQDNYMKRDIAILSSWCQLMRECAVTQVAKNGIDSSNSITFDNAAVVVDHWMSIYLNQPQGVPDISPPLLSTSELKTFYNIIFQFEYERLELIRIVKEISLSPLMDWDKFIVSPILLKGWISLEGKFRISRDELNTISSELNTEEIERWVAKYVKRYRDLEVPLPIFA